jgi:hypothetical protein
VSRSGEIVEDFATASDERGAAWERLLRAAERGDEVETRRLAVEVAHGVLASPVPVGGDPRRRGPSTFLAGGRSRGVHRTLPRAQEDATWDHSASVRRLAMVQSERDDCIDRGRHLDPSGEERGLVDHVEGGRGGGSTQARFQELDPGPPNVRDPQARRPVVEQGPPRRSNGLC